MMRHCTNEILARPQVKRGALQKTGSQVQQEQQL